MDLTFDLFSASDLEFVDNLILLKMIGVFLIFYGAIMTISPTCILHVAQAWSTDSLESTFLSDQILMLAMYSIQF